MQSNKLNIFLCVRQTKVFASLHAVRSQTSTENLREKHKYLRGRELRSEHESYVSFCD